jgi:hypothetical protein
MYIITEILYGRRILYIAREVGTKLGDVYHSRQKAATVTTNSCSPS